MSYKAIVEQAWRDIRVAFADPLMSQDQKENAVKCILDGVLAQPPRKTYQYIPCPFCGELENIFGKQSENGELLFWVECDVCHVTTDIETTPEKAFNAWNRRATPPGFERVPEGTKALLDAAIRFIDAHPCDPDITKEQREAWGVYSKLLTAHRATQKGGEPEAPDYKARYHELLYQVSIKHPDETRHQTALRYLKNAENQNNVPQQAKETPNAQG